MRIFEILSEATPKQGYGAFRAMDPKTFDTVWNIQNYNRELKKNKAEIQKQKQKEKPATNEKEPALKIYYSIRINKDIIDNYEKTKDKNIAFTIGKTWYTSSIPEKIINEIVKDSQWQKLVVAIMDFAVIKNKLPNLPTEKDIPNWLERSKEYSKVLKIRKKYGPVGMEFERRLFDIIQKYLTKYNIDKTGRQLPIKK